MRVAALAAGWIYAWCFFNSQHILLSACVETHKNVTRSASMLGLKAHTRSQQQKGPPDCLCACNMHHCGLSCLLTRCLQNFFVYTGRIIGRAVRWEPVALNLTHKNICAERTCWQDWVILCFVCKCGCALHCVATKCIGDRFSAC